jgi:glycosyltransferase involved in cell wall biosynthesis
VARRLGVPLFITIRGFETEYVGMPDVGPPMLAALRSARGIVAVSHSLRDLAVAHQVPPERVAVVHNAVNSRVFHYVEREAARTRLGLDPSRPLLVAVGHLISRKRHHVLLEAFARLHAGNPAARLAIIGAASFEADYPARLREQVRALGLGDAVQFLGNLEPAVVADWLAVADAFVLATAREGCCNAVLEALAVGTPVVTTPVGDNAHFVKESVNGFLVPVDDSESLAVALGRVLGATTLAPRVEIAAALHRQVGDWDDVAGRVLAFFRERLAATAAGAGESAR